MTANVSSGWENATALQGLPHPSSWLGAMTYDAGDGYVLWFGAHLGANGGPPIAETWSFQGGQWTDRTGTPSQSPPALQGVGLAYDAVDGYVVLFGGFIPDNRSFAHPSDTWAYRAGVWTNLTPTAGTPPPGEYHPAMTYDVAAGFVLLAAFGRTTSGDSTFQTWSFSGGQWHDITASTGRQPEGREQAAMAYDAANAESVLYGGNFVKDSTAAFAYNNTWIFHSGAWQNVTKPGAAAPLPVADLSMSETVGGHVVVIGGFDLPGCARVSLPVCGDNRTWVFFDGAWNELTAVLSGAPPAVQTDAPMAWDPIDGYGVLLDDNSNTWFLHWNVSRPTLSLTPPHTWASTGGSLPFAVAEFGGTPPYNLTLCPGSSACLNLPSLAASAVQVWSPSFPVAGNWTVYGRVLDANGSAATAALTVRAAAVSGPIGATVVVLPNAGNVPFNVSVWVNVSGGAPPYTISVTFGDGGNGSALSSVRLPHTYSCGPMLVNGQASCWYDIGAYVVDSIGEVWSSPLVPVVACASNPPNQICYPPQNPPSSFAGSALGLLHAGDARYVGGYAMLLFGGGISAVTLRHRRRESEEEAQQLLRQLEPPPFDSASDADLR